MIVISKSATSVNASEISGALIGATVQNPALSEFLLLADSLSLKPTSARACDTKYWMHEVAMQLAAGAPRLRAFCCTARDLHTFPAMPSLKHLMLDLRCATLKGGVASLSALTSLETLHLHGHQHYPDCCSDLYDDGPLFDCPLLELGGLRHLQSVALTGITPEGITVRSGCKVHVNVSGLHSGHHPLWEALSPDSLQSLTWQSLQDSYLEEDIDDIPLLLFKDLPWNLDKLDLQVSAWTVKEVPASMLALRYLSIAASVLEICVPASARWEQVFLYGADMLCVGFEDMGAFACKPPFFSFESAETLQPRDHWLALDSALMRSNCRWVSMRNELRLGKGLRHLCNVCQPGKMAETEQHTYFACKGHFDLIPCICAACVDCLAARGKISTV